MLKTVEAVIEKDGRLRLLEKVNLTGKMRVLVTFLDERAGQHDASETAAASEAVLAKDWNRPEEDEAWRHLQ